MQPEFLLRRQNIPFDNSNCQLSLYQIGIADLVICLAVLPFFLCSFPNLSSFSAKLHNYRAAPVSLPQRSACSLWQSIRWARELPFVEKISLAAYALQSKISSHLVFVVANDVYKNTDHNDLIDSPDSLADEMGKLEGEIPFPPVPVNYYFVLLAISILIDFGNIFFLFFSWVGFCTNKKNLTWWSLHLLHVQARGWSRRTQWKVLTKVNKSAVDSPFSTSSVD